MWMFPFSRHCDARKNYFKRSQGKDDADDSAFVCDKEEYSIASSAWPVDVVKVEVPENLGEYSAELFQFHFNNQMHDDPDSFFLQCCK